MVTTEQIDQIGSWLNNNQGIVSILIFLFTLFLGWASGIFSSLRRNPKLRLQLLAGPSFCSTFPTGGKYGDHDEHRTAIALYLHIANLGSAPTSVEKVAVGYHWSVKPFSLHWLRYRFFWFWLQDQTTALTDFHVAIGDNFKVYPFLFQRNSVASGKGDTYLEIGQSVNGIVYFEQPESWGACFPLAARGHTRVIVSITDVFGTNHKKRFWVPIVTVAEAKKYNPSFGETRPALRRGPSSPTQPVHSDNC